VWVAGECGQIGVLSALSKKRYSNISAHTAPVKAMKALSYDFS
jgi:hypothetical protein